MTEPPDPLRYSRNLNLDLNREEEAELQALGRACGAALRNACRARGEEQDATARREQIEAGEALHDFWRRMAALQLPGVAAELSAWLAWRKQTGGRRVVEAGA